jgi:hypothetical protein
VFGPLIGAAFGAGAGVAVRAEAARDSGGDGPVPGTLPAAPLPAAAATHQGIKPTRPVYHTPTHQHQR